MRRSVYCTTAIALCFGLLMAFGKTVSRMRLIDVVVAIYLLCFWFCLGASRARHWTSPLSLWVFFEDNYRSMFIWASADTLLYTMHKHFSDFSQRHQT